MLILALPSEPKGVKVAEFWPILTHGVPPFVFVFLMSCPTLCSNSILDLNGLSCPIWHISDSVAVFGQLAESSILLGAAHHGYCGASNLLTPL